MAVPMKTLTLDGRSLDFDALRQILGEPVPGRSIRLKLSSSALKRVSKSRKTIDRALAAGKTIYGVNTGFGKLADTRVDAPAVEQLQKNLLLSHAAGLDFTLGRETAALVVVLRINSLVRGNSGVTPGLLRYLVKMHNDSIVPLLPEVGSVGASGDLLPLSQLGAVMLGEGDAIHFEKEKRTVRKVTKPYRFKAKEALSLINGVQYSSAVLAETLVGMELALKLADIAGTMSLEALRGSVKPFDRRVHDVRPHPGQGRVAKNVRKLLRGSKILESHRNCKKVQDAYCLRCIPQVHGAVRDVAEYARKTLLCEINSATDNPLVFDNGDVISAGNFHGQPIALAADSIATALASLANISERRLDRMTNPDLSELPPFLVSDSGLHSGYMMIQVAAASLTAEIRTDAAPASVHSIPTEGGQEDHVPMAAYAARKARKVMRNTLRVLGLELLCGAQGIDFLKPVRPGRAIQAAHLRIRKEIPFLEVDRYLQPEVQKITDSTFLGSVLKAVEKSAGKLD